PALGAAPGAAPPPGGAGAEGGAAGGPTRVPVARVAPRRFRILFTCRICERRNENLISRVAYGHGIVIVTCPGCTNRHLISDKTGLLQRSRWDVEMLAGENVTRLGGSGLLQVQTGDRPPAPQAPPDGRGLDTPGLLVRRRGGVVEAVLESGVSTTWPWSSSHPTTTRAGGCPHGPPSAAGGRRAAPTLPRPPDGLARRRPARSRGGRCHFSSTPSGLRSVCRRRARGLAGEGERRLL
ncbi:unnamed protein product, partial [Prorocentrum cordatum]